MLSVAANIAAPAGTSPELVQARGWAAHKIVSADLLRLIGKIDTALRPWPNADEEEDEEDLLSYETANTVPWDDAVDLIREASNHYPHPAGGMLFDAAFRRMPHGPDRFEPHIEADDLVGIIIDILENPDALLG